jgi:hypothetical protein
MIPVETFPIIRGGRMKESNRGGEFKYIWYIVRAFVISTIIKKEKA